MGSSVMDSEERIVFKIVLTGGPCGGKSTGQQRLCTFFENLGWKVYRVPETASVLLGGGIKFSDLDQEQALKFQENLLKTMMQIENTFFQLAETGKKNCLVICDRGTMDATAFISPHQWESMMESNKWDPIEIRDNRYNMVIHMVSAAIGAEKFYTTEDHSCRSEGVQEARERDMLAAGAWVGHPYFDVIDNSTDFDTKIRRLMSVVTQKIGLDTGDRLNQNSRKVKFLVHALSDDCAFPQFQDFDVIHHYLHVDSDSQQVRLRKRGQHGVWSYTHTVRRLGHDGQRIEAKTQLGAREYQNLLSQRSKLHNTVYKTRRCFLYNNQYFQLDIYQEPCHPRCRGLILLETYTTLGSHRLKQNLPDFLQVERDVTNDPAYSMYNLSLIRDWASSKDFNKAFTPSASSEDLEALERQYLSTPNLSNGHSCHEKSNGHLYAVHMNGGTMNGHS